MKTYVLDLIKLATTNKKITKIKTFQNILSNLINSIETKLSSNNTNLPFNIIYNFTI